LNLFEFET
jgi:hypothetical protein